MRYAAIDAGTNTIRLLVADVEGRDIIPLVRRRFITGLGKEIIRTGCLGEQEKASTIEALKIIAGEMKKCGVGCYFAAGTHAFRQASDADTFISEIREDTGIEMTVIPPGVEATLTFEGITKTLKREVLRNSIFIDIGGGSTEIIRNRPGGNSWASTNLGVIYLQSLFAPHDPPLVWEMENMGLFVKDRLERVKRAMGAKVVRQVVGTAGTYTTIAAIQKRMKRYDPDKINGTRITLKKLRGLSGKLAGLTGKERMKVPGMEKGREYLILPGLVIAEKAMETFSAPNTVVSDGSLLEGTIHALREKKVEGVIYEPE